MANALWQAKGEHQKNDKIEKRKKEIDESKKKKKPKLIAKPKGSVQQQMQNPKAQSLENPKAQSLDEQSEELKAAKARSFKDHWYGDTRGQTTKPSSSSSSWKGKR
eukprot:s1214_g25.t1